MQNYARLTPVYLAEMFSLKETDPCIWNYFDKGYFCVNKSAVPHSAIGADHSIKHENRAMKVLGGIKGTANNRLALEQNVLIIPEIPPLLMNFVKRLILQIKVRPKYFSLLQ